MKSDSYILRVEMKRLVYTFILAVIVPALCMAQDDIQQAGRVNYNMGSDGILQKSLTLKECIDLAKENNQRIKAANFEMRKTEYDLRSVKGNFFPSISLDGMGIYTSADGKYSSGGGMLPVIGMDGQPTGASAYFPGIDLTYKIGMMYNTGLMLEQPVYLGGKVRKGYKMQRLGSELAGENIKLAEQQVVVETSKAYANAVRAKELLSVAKAYNKLLEELMRSVQKAKQQGMKSRNDVLKVAVKLNESKLNVRRAENGYKLASMNLCHYIGYSLTSKIEVDTLLPAVDYSNGYAALNGNALQGDITERPEYVMLDKKSELARRNIEFVRSEGLPQVGLMGQFGYLHGLELNNKRMFGNWNYLVGLKVSIPIYNFGSKANKVRSAKAAYQQVLAEQHDKSQMLELEMTQAANNLNEAALEIQLAESSVASANENLRVSKRAYEVGVESLSDYLEAQTLWHQAQETLIDARVNRYLFLIEYMKASGSLKTQY